MRDEIGIDRIRSIFERAVQLDPNSRAAYLSDSCDSDELRSRVEYMLRVHESGASWLESLTGIALDQAPAAHADEPLVPERLGRYEVVRCLATGGMGVVLEGLQQTPRRSVAIKMMSYHLGSESATRRFREEVEILGRLQHPAIARIYDADVESEGADGVPYFVMELVPQARTLIAYARDHGLSMRERLELFARVCDGVHHGHQKGVIHRDLKPDNILVDGTGNPKIIDFGVARVAGPDLVRRTILADAGGLAGTLQYMSPEQLDADARDVDTRSDVYSLGVVLYELLAGEPPHDLRGRPIGESLRVLREEKPALLSTLSPDLPPDVERIVHKALDRDRDRRYQSAADLGADIQRFLRDEPILAHPPSLMYQLRLAVQRHRPLAAAVGALALTLVAATILSTFHAIEADRARSRAEEAETDADEARSDADEARAEAEREAERARAVESFFQKALPSIKPPNRGDRIAYLDALDTLAALLDEGAVGNQPRSEISLRRTLGSAYRSQMAYEEALHQLGIAVAMCEVEYGPDDRTTFEALSELLVLFHLGGTSGPRVYNGMTEAELAQDLVDRSAILFGEDDPLYEQALGDLARALPDGPQTLPVWLKLWEIAERKHGPEDWRTAFPQRVYAATLIFAGRAREAPELLQHSLDVCERLEHESGIRDTRLFLCMAYLSLGLMEDALQSIEPVAHPDLSVAEAHPPYWCVSVYVQALIGLGRLNEAEAALRPALQSAQEALSGHFVTKDLVASMIEVLRETGRIDEAVAHATEADELPSMAGEVAHGWLWLDVGDPDRALAIADRAAQHWSKADIPDERNPYLQPVRMLRAAALVRTDQAEAALEPLHGAITTMESICEPAHPELAAAHRLLGTAKARLGRDDAEATLRRALSLDLEHRGENDRSTAKSRLALAEFLTSVGRVDEARTQLDEAERILRDSPFEEGLWLPRVARAREAL